jgi:DnaK suppressor protein
LHAFGLVDTTSLASFRTILENKLVELYRSSHDKVRQGMTRQLDALDQEEPRDEAEEAQRVSARDARITMGEREAQLAQLIEASLERMTNGEYGICVDCGREIELDRLQLVPWTLRCVADQEAQEFQGRDRSPSL